MTLHTLPWPYRLHLFVAVLAFVLLMLPAQAPAVTVPAAVGPATATPTATPAAATPAATPAAAGPIAPGIAATSVASPAGGASSEVCTNFAQRKLQVFGGVGATGAPTAPGTPASEGLLSSIYRFIKDVVADASRNLFEAFTGDSRYQSALGAVFILTVIFFGVAFTMGLLQLSYGQVLMRLIKIGVVMTLISPGGWYFFSNTVVSFFNDGTDQLVKTVVQIGTGVVAPPGSTPFYQFDKMAEFIISPEIIKMLMGVFSAGPFGLAMAGLTAIGIFGFVDLLIKALRMYAVSFVARSMLLGLAPVFFTFLLFDKTKQLFLSWVNALLSMSLQPVLMFTFLSFFIVLLESASKDMLSTEFCWTEYKNIKGSTNTMSGYRPVDPCTGQPVRSDITWQGAIACLLNSGSSSTMPGLGMPTTPTPSASGGGAPGSCGACPESPLNIINILTFLILVYIANRFSGMIEEIANELSNSFIGLDTAGKIGEAIGNQASSVANWVRGGSSGGGKTR